MSVIKAVLLCAVGFSCVGGTPASATPIHFPFTLTVNPKVFIHPTLCDVSGGFACATSLGDTFVGQFTVDDSVLLGDGIKDGVPITNFFLKIGRVAWDQNGGDPDNFFGGFRDSHQSLAPSPGLVVSGGALVDLRGGVIGGGDVPFVDFTTFSPHRFIAFDAFGSSEIPGSLRIGAVPEPSTFLLTLIGALSLCAVARARAIPRSSSAGVRR